MSSQDLHAYATDARRVAWYNWLLNAAHDRHTQNACFKKWFALYNSRIVFSYKNANRNPTHFEIELLRNLRVKKFFLIFSLNIPYTFFAQLYTPLSLSLSLTEFYNSTLKRKSRFTQTFAKKLFFIAMIASKGIISFVNMFLFVKYNVFEVPYRRWEIWHVRCPCMRYTFPCVAHDARTSKCVKALLTSNTEIKKEAREELNMHNIAQHVAVSHRWNQVDC